jgi:radical SAM protein with 4Fe4S-binding SPASM domain
MKEFLRKYYFKNRFFKNRKFENHIFAEDDLRLLSLHQKIKPHLALVEITKSCNLSCEYCPNNSYNGKNIFMNLDVYKSIIDQLPPDIELQPVGLGESSLHPEFPEMVEYASTSNKFKLISVTTNLTAKKSDYYSILFEKGMSFLSFSIDTFNPMTISKTRLGTDPERLILNIKMIARLFPDSTSAHLTLSDMNLPDLKETIEKLIELGVRRMTMKNAIKFNSETNSYISNLSEGIVMEIIGNYRDQIDIKLVQTERCTRPFNEIAVDAYGNLFFCHYSFIDSKNGYGKIQNDLMKKYYSEEFNLLRSTFYSKRPGLCTFCPYYPVL